MQKISKTSVDKLTLGLYVSRLDRPWVETPFLFQGFVIKTPHEISELRRYCSDVYIDVDKSNLSAEDQKQVQLAVSTPSKFGTSIKRFCWGLFKIFFAPLFIYQKAKERKLASTEYKLKALKVELVLAKHSYEQANLEMTDAMESLQKGKKLNVPKIEQNLKQMIDSIMRNPDAMVWLNRMKSKDTYVYNHSISSSVWATIFGKHLNLPPADLQILGLGVMLMDVGKMKLPTQLLMKQEKFTDAQMEIMRRHVLWSLEILQQTPGVNDQILEIAATHHERHNGSGYPKGLKSFDIPVYGRIAGIVDCYDAMTSQRQFGDTLSPLNAMNELTKLKGVDFQEEMVEKFIQAIGIFPTGTLVELNTGQVGVVISQNPARRLRPKVMLILDWNKTLLQTQSTIDLVSLPANKNDAKAVWVVKGLEAGAHGVNPSEFFLPDAGEPKNAAPSQEPVIN